MTDSSFGFESMGTQWHITVWDDIPPDVFQLLQKEIIGYCERFDNLYSRFIKDSFISHLSKKTGVQEVPQDLVIMLRLYEKLYKLSEGKCTPLVADTLHDLGYDADYSLKINPSGIIRKVPNFSNTLQIIDDTHIELTQQVLLDLGAIGKGYAVDALAKILDSHSVHHYLVDGSGDIRFSGPSPIKVGLEHPNDPKKVIGSIDFATGAMCSSAGNRRTWGGMHHIIDPHTGTSPDHIIASWVIAETAALADGLSTALFLSPPEQFQDNFAFDYLLLDKNLKVKRSQGFTAELY